jgi:hypothetical protein
MSMVLLCSARRDLRRSAGIGTLVLLIVGAPGVARADLPVAEAGPDQFVDEGDTVQLDASASTGGGYQITGYAWDFDGDLVFDYQETAGYAPDGAFDGKTPYAYPDNGVYTVTLQVTNSAQATATDTLIVTVNNVVPEATILSGVGVAENYIIVTNSNGLSYYLNIENDGALGDPEFIDDKAGGTYGAGIGDFDNDGDLDALVGDMNNTWYYEKIGEGNSFAPAVSVDDTVHSRSRMDFAEADYNNDGNLDAIMADYYSNYLTIYTGSGDGTFTRNTLTCTSWIFGLDSADFNNDGNEDFIASSAYSAAPDAYIYFGNGDGTFQSPMPSSSGLSYGVCAGDFDNDGNDDFIVGYPQCRFVHGNGDGTFADPVTLGFRILAMAESDIDVDGNLDLICTFNNIVYYYEGNGDGTFALECSRIIIGGLYGIATSPEPGAGPIEVNEGEVSRFTGTFSDPGWVDTHTATWDWGDGSPVEPGNVTETNEPPAATGEVAAEHSYGDDGQHTITLTVCDDDGGCGSDTAIVNVYNVAPRIEAIITPVEPTELDTAIEVSAEFTDPGWLDTHTAIIDWGDSQADELGMVMSPILMSHTYAEPGVYTLGLEVTDDDGGSEWMEFRYVVVYDPEGGFVTGGGWIDSPEGAYVPDPLLTGRAHFGFVSKYVHGQQHPAGNTEFQFRVADLNFHSSAYDWLVIAGAKAMYRGIGTINGAGNYGFMISAIDEELTPSTDVDLFRMKIWDRDDDDAVVYDNQLGDPEDSDPVTAVGVGQIVIHRN